MYDFEERRDDGSTLSSERFPKPPLALTALELARVMVEYPTSAVVDAILPSHGVGEGRPVLVIPGFYATDGLTSRMRSHLRGLGYRAHGWHLGRNFGLTDHIVEGLPDRLDRLHQRYGVPVSVVGWSFGGLLARWLGHERPDAVRQVICLGSPWRPEGEVTRTTAMFEHAARKYGLVDNAREIVDTLRGPLPVRCTAIYSKTDGILNWRSCALDEDDNGENIAVLSSHIGLVSNPLALSVLADRLAQNPLAPEPFDWARCVRHTLLGPSVSAPTLRKSA
ncbi:alpha/beta hydrolase [Williamsia muralis]|uniref:esterase/lipase family protein n=1 Tax=Williamsia marianensis TaxID=85044 RepID=UPI003F146D99